MSRRRKKKPGTLGMWSDSQRIGAVTTYLACGSMTTTSVATDIPIATLKRWRLTPWWKQMVEDIRQEESLHLDAKLAKVVNKSVEQLMDRVESGDFQYDQKTGKMVRVPIKARDAAKITTDMIDRRKLLQDSHTEKTEGTKRIEDKLLKLADEFTRFARAKVVKEEPLTIDMEIQSAS